MTFCYIMEKESKKLRLAGRAVLEMYPLTNNFRLGTVFRSLNHLKPWPEMTDYF